MIFLLCNSLWIFQIWPFPIEPWVSQAKNPPATHKMQVQSLGQEDPMEEGMATNSSILAWRIPWIEGPGGLWTIGSQRVEHSWSNWANTHRTMWSLSLLIKSTILYCLHAVVSLNLRVFGIYGLVSPNHCSVSSPTLAPHPSNCTLLWEWDLSRAALNSPIPRHTRNSDNILPSASCPSSRLWQGDRCEKDLLLTPGKTSVGGMIFPGRC